MLLGHDPSSAPSAGHNMKRLSETVFSFPKRALAVRLLVHRLCRREIIGEVAPLRPGAGDPEQGTRHVPDSIFPLLRLLVTEEEVGKQKEVPAVVYIAGVALPDHRLLLLYPHSNANTSNLFLVASSGRRPHRRPPTRAPRRPGCRWQTSPRAGAPALRRGRTRRPAACRGAGTGERRRTAAPR